MKRAGLATHHVPSEALPELERELRQQGAYMRDAAAVDRTISSFEEVHHCGNSRSRHVPSCQCSVPMNLHASAAAVDRTISSFEVGTALNSTELQMKHRWNDESGDASGMLVASRCANVQGAAASVHAVALRRSAGRNKRPRPHLRWCIAAGGR